MPHSPARTRPSAPTAPRLRPVLLHDFFARAARRWPDHVAVETPPSPATGERRTITYAELDQQSEALARTLREVVTAECVVAVLLPRTSELIYLAQLAVLKAGAAYTCIDPTFPDAQVETIFNDAKPVAVLTDASGFDRAERFAPTASHVIDAGIRREPLSKPLPKAPWLSPRSLAYVIYTSGTTGRPKGVMIEHAGIANLIRGDGATFPVSPDDRVGQNSSCAYDSSLEEIWMAFAAGATLVVMDDATTRLGPDLVPWLRRERVSIFSPPPTLLRATGCANPEKELPLLRRIHVGGEPLPPDVALRWAPGRVLINDYGPTECSVVALRAEIAAGEHVSIGRAVPGIQAFVLNDNLEEVAPGETGELCLGGAGLARGYLNDAAMTARKFPIHPKLGRLYRTGDLARRDADGTFHCLGRIDTQVKVRGYRIELEAIESRLMQCAGVQAAACRVQGDGPHQQIVAFVVPDGFSPSPSKGGRKTLSFDDLRSTLARDLPAYMVPSRFGLLDRLPTTVSGKLDRRALPMLENVLADADAPIVAPRTAAQMRIATAMQRALGVASAISVDHDFFTDLGGDSLRAAELISALRDDPTTASLTVRDLYEARTVAGLASRVRIEKRGGPVENSLPRPTGRPWLATFVQTLWLLFGLVLGGPLAYGIAFAAVPELSKDLGLVPFLLVSPLLIAVGLAAYTAVAVLLAVLVKTVLIGRYRPRSEPVWGGFHVRNWMVQRTAALIPWRLVEGTALHAVILRRLGATIGARVHIHRGVNLTLGGWDLLAIGDDVTLSQDASLRLVELVNGQIVVGPVTLGAGSTIDIRAGVAAAATLEAEAYLSPLSALAAGATIPRGERWDGVPALPAGHAPEVRNVAPALSPAAHAVAMLAARGAVAAFVALPLELPILLAAFFGDFNGDEAAELLLHPALGTWGIVLGILAVTLAVPSTLLFQALAMRLLGRVPPGVISRWSLAYIRVWIKTGLLNSANAWLSGTLLWRAWLRAAGMTIGRNSEVGTIIDTLPELVTLGTGTFFADGIYLGGPLLHRGTVTLAPIRIGDGVFLGNHVVVASGQRVPDDVLLGVCTVADDAVLRPGTSWFGLPPFELPKREIVEMDRRLTHEPTTWRYLNRLAWELLRFTLPIVPVLLAFAWLDLVAASADTVSLPALLFGIVPLLDLAVIAVLCTLVLVLKWLLLGRVRPGQHPLYSSWVSRWDFHYTVWEFYAHGPLTALEGTLWLNMYLRAMGVTLGRRVALGPGFAHVVDPDMLHFADDATVSGVFQAHTFEDRVLKIDHVTVGPAATVGTAAVLLYGADVGEGVRVLPNSVVMKRERLHAGRVYSGCPTRAVD